MTSTGFARRAVLGAFVLALGGSLHASDTQPARSFRLVERLDTPRVISWQALSRHPGGHFVLWRIGQDSREVARLDAKPGTHRYRFVDADGSTGAGFVVYRLAFEADGHDSLLLVATLATSNLRDGVVLVSASVPHDALASTAAGLEPQAQPADGAPGRDAQEFFEFSGPEPPPPRG